ncbi:hypothetical protein GUITHDRAFT_137819 [Guillardia theta CCMP2712]|uniref:Potassium channel domain-containing protein n=1 Tax=Guillardia theta (strain CCMP2712) TaxID=905079 RepID=L1JE64_GUITC|nr:hypothetical protein GUITHDRAFT_137819 [Guillardia theta CCMP2712]EKX46808.1 hypothetical protein GUITHDRAFT_137819 [Guillardia theta CCMP2712]|eukprot:XP_005833788.1 hypothetical protein GUITHDRAFT_137819 [Guillardia theta CCMP2712]
MRIDVEMLGRVAVYRFESLIVIWMFFRLYLAYLLVRRWLFMHYFEEAAFNLGDEATLQMIFNPANKIGGKLALKVALKRHPLRFIGGMALVSIVVMAYCTRVAEGCANRIHSNYFWNQTLIFLLLIMKLWMVMVTMSTTGYGDMYPVTHAGRFVSIFAMLAGFLFTAIFTASATRAFDLNDNEAELMRIMSIESMRCRLVVASARLSRNFDVSRVTRPICFDILMLNHVQRNILISSLEIRKIVQQEVEKLISRNDTVVHQNDQGNVEQLETNLNIDVKFQKWERRFTELEAQVGNLCHHVENLLESLTAVQSNCCSCQPSRNDKYNKFQDKKDKIVVKDKIHKDARTVSEQNCRRSIDLDRSYADQSNSSRGARSSSKEIEWSNYMLERQLKDQRRSQDSADIGKRMGMDLTFPQRQPCRGSKKSTSDSLWGNDTSDANVKLKHGPSMSRTVSESKATGKDKAFVAEDAGPVRRRSSVSSREVRLALVSRATDTAQGSFKFLHEPQDIGLRLDNPQVSIAFTVAASDPLKKQQDRGGLVKSKCQMIGSIISQEVQVEYVVRGSTQSLSQRAWPSKFVDMKLGLNERQNLRGSIACVQ